jgi:hypothetical protein
VSAQSIPINRADAENLQKQVMTLPEAARAVVIHDQASYEFAAEKLLTVAAMRREIVEYHAPLKQKAHEAHKAICNAEASMLAPVAEAEKILKQGIAAYQIEQRRIQEEQERLARQAAEQARLEALEASIEAAEAEGASVEEVQAIIEQPMVTPAVRVAPTIQHVAGVSAAKTYRAEVINIRELCKAVAMGQCSEAYVTANMPALNGVARSTRGSIRIPGVRIVEDATVRAGRR